jgi:hypothetical protein
VIFADEQFKWFFWLAPILMVVTILTIFGLTSGYVKKVLLPKHRGRRVE